MDLDITQEKGNIGKGLIEDKKEPVTILEPIPHPVPSEQLYTYAVNTPRQSARITQRREEGRVVQCDPSFRQSNKRKRKRRQRDDSPDIPSDEEALKRKRVYAFWSQFQDRPSKHLLELGNTATIIAVIAAAARKHRAAPDRIIIVNNLTPPPKTWAQLLKHPLKELFLKAYDIEIDKLVGKEAWEEQADKHIGKLLPLKWVFTYRADQHGNLERYKARLCVRGDLQEKGHFEQTYAATLAAKSFRIAIAIAAAFDLEIIQLDIKNAFLNATRNAGEEPIFCEMPRGYRKKGMVLRLWKALYGLRDSPKLWFDEFSRRLAQLGYIRCAEEPCLYYNRARKIFVLFFVDDILILHHSDDKTQAESLVTSLQASYELVRKDTAEWFLGVRITCDRTAKKIYLDHQ
jgi:hypothetical protein